MVQDDRGFMWFGAQYGLNRFDGYSFKVYSHDPERRGSLSGVFITALFKDRAGVVWVGCNQFLDKFNPVTETFTHYKLDAHSPAGTAVTVTQISQDSDGILWLATGKGLYRFDPATGRSKRYTNDPNNPETLARNDIKSTGLDRSGAFWVGNSEGLDKFNRATGRFNLHISLPASASGLTFHEDRLGNFWVIHGADSELSLLNLRSNTLTDIALSEQGDLHHRDSFSSMLEDRDGVMWFGTSRNGLLKFDRALNRLVRYRNRPDDPDSLANNAVLTLLQDREGNIWTGLHGSGPNFCSLLPLMFRDLSKISGQGAPAGLTSVLHYDAGGILWVGAGGVLRQLNRETGRAADFVPTKGFDVLSIVEQAPDRVWFGTSGGGIIRYDPNTRHSKRYMPTNAVERILIAHDGALWAAAWYGLQRYDPASDTFVAFRPNQRSGGLNFHSIAEGREGKLWLGSNLGLFRFDPASGQFTSYANDPDDATSLSDNRVNSIYFDHAGTMWLGTQNGLDIFDPTSQKFKTYYRRDGLPGNVISCIQEDRLHVLWMSTNNGISGFDPRKGSFRNYNVADGLPGPDLTGWAACAKSPAGEFFFGGFSGSTAFFPGSEQDNSFSPPTVLTDFRLFGEPVKISTGSPLSQSIASASSITLSHWQNFVSFEFSALSYYNAATNRYRYRLEDLDHKWTEVAGDQRLANYTSVPPGDYTFRVQSATSRGA